MTYGKRWMVSVKPRVQRREQKSKNNQSQRLNFCLNKCILLDLEIGGIGGMCPAGFQNCYESAILICFLPSSPFKWEYLLFYCSYLTTVSRMLVGTRYLFTPHIFRSRGDAPKEPHLYRMTSWTSKPKRDTIMR